MTARATARDHAAELDAALDAVLGARPLVTVSGDGRPSCAIDFGPAPAGPWGQVVDGDVLRVELPAGADPEHVRAAAVAAGCRITTDRVAVRGAPVPELVDGLSTGYPGREPLTLVVDPAALGDAERGLLRADVARLASLLTSAPPNVLTPLVAARLAERAAAGAGLECRVRTGRDLDGFGALLAIGSGSSNPPALVELTYRAPAASERIALVGKGITFDSGGLSLKSPAAMQNMRLDVAGAATVLAVMAALPRLGCAVDVHAVLPFAENLPGPGAARPGDVVTAWNGTQIQILDTDFEGRVVLADALAVAAAQQPDLIVDLATLTYQAEIALGPKIAAVLGRDDGAVGRVLAASATAGEPMWRLPWADRYLDQVRVPFGVRNHPLHDSGRAITAALFLGEFVPGTVPWVHCDMTGPAWDGDASGDNATGFGARTLLTLLAPPR